MLKLTDAVRNSDGISLLEVMIAVAIGLIGVAGSYSLLASMNSTRTENMEVLQAQQEARNIMERMTRELRESSPEVVWPQYYPDIVLPEGDTEDGETSWVYFFTPRNINREFIVNAEGEPSWQRGIEYWLDWNTNILYRFQFYLNFNPAVDNWDTSDWYTFEEISKNVEKLTFKRENDMFTIHLRTFADSDGGLGNVARSYADLNTTIKLRN